MLRNRLNKVLFIGPQHITKWMGYAIATSKTGLAAMDKMGYRMATEQDIDILPPDVIAQCGLDQRLDPVRLDPIEAIEEAPTAPKRGRPRKNTNTTPDADRP